MTTKVRPEKLEEAAEAWHLDAAEDEAAVMSRWMEHIEEHGLEGRREKGRQWEHSKSKCMVCKAKPPEVDVRWANGHGRAWFCETCYGRWLKAGGGKGPMGRDVSKERKITDGVAAENFGDRLKHLGGKHDQQAHGKRGGAALTGDEAHASLMKGDHSKITDSQRDNLNVYQEMDYVYTNGLLRGIYSEGELGGYAQRARENTSEMDGAFKNAPPLADTIMVERKGVDFGMSEGMTFTDKGFVSTSAKLPDDYSFTGAAPGGTVYATMRITVPAGVKAVYYPKLNGTNRYDEFEVLLNRGTTFNVTRAGYQEGGRTYFDLEVVA